MRALSHAILPFTLALAACHGSPEAASPSDVLPLRTIRLYETGVGYFERAGRIAAESDALPVPASHVDDALKTLVVMADGADLAISGIEFESLVSRGLARSLAALPLEADKPVTYADVLRSLMGVDVEIDTERGPATGKLVEVAPAPPIPLDVYRGEREADAEKRRAERFAADTQDDHYLTLLAADGSVRRHRASRLRGIRPTDPDLAARLSSAVGALGDRAAQIRRSLRVLSSREAPVRLGYVAETPVWRSTYRLVLEPGSDRGALQGWALVHNDTDERWSGVRIELVNGRPDSFLFPLTAPRYTRRPLAEPADVMSTVPQLADKTADQLWGDHVQTTGTGTGYGYGSGHGRLGGSHHTKAPRVRMGATMVTSGASDAISIGNLAEVAQATGLESGALFSYALTQAVDLRAHGSALVPFTQGQVAVRRLTWFDVAGEQGRSGARLTNTTAQTIPPGPVAVYEATGFAGETGVRRLKPKERAFLRFGIDLDVELLVDASKATDSLRKVQFADRVLRSHYVRHHDRAYQLTNRGGHARVVYLVLDIVANAKVVGADEVDFDGDERRPLAVFRVAPGEKSPRTLAIDEGIETAASLDALSAADLRERAAAEALPVDQRALLGRAAALLEEGEKKHVERQDVNRELERLHEDLERVREHLKALGDKSGSPAAANPLVTRILELEDAMAKLRRSGDQLDDARARKTSEAEAVLTGLGA